MTRPILVTSVFALLTCAASVSETAEAWGHVGHAVIAARAERELTPQARTQLTRLLDALGVKSLAQIASWSDERRTRATAHSHFTNMPADDCVYRRERDCPDGQCLVEAVKQRISVLSDVRNPVNDRAAALVDVVHLAGGDSSQPLHSGMYADKGGNTYQVVFGSRHTNLHAMWDSDLIYAITQAGDDDQAVARMGAELDLAAPPQRATPSLRPEDWVGESCQVAHEAGFYPSDHTISTTYVAQARPVVDAQMIQGADELAGVLNAALVGRDPEAMTR